MTVHRTNLVTNPKPLLGSGSVEYRRNYALLPVPTSTLSYSFQNKSGGASTGALVTGAADGPVPGLATYLRRTVTTGVDSGTAAWGPYSYTTAPGPVVAGSTWTVSVYVRCSMDVSARLTVSGRTGGAQQGTAASGSYVTLPAGQWVRLSTTLTADAAAEHIGWWVNSPSPYPTGMTFDTTGVLVEKTDQVRPYFDGATTPDPLLVPSWTGTAGASASVLTAQAPTGWVVSNSETAVLVTDDDGEPCVELIDPVGGGGGYIYPLNNAADTPGVGRWVALGVDVKPLTADQASRMRLHVRTRSGSTWAGAQSTPTGDGWTAGQWTRQVVSVQQTGAADRLDAIIWPTQTPNPGPQFRARRAVVAFADTQEAAEAAVESYFDGDTPDTNIWRYSWTGTPHASHSVQSVAPLVAGTTKAPLRQAPRRERYRVDLMTNRDGTIGRLDGVSEISLQFDMSEERVITSGGSLRLDDVGQPIDWLNARCQPWATVNGQSWPLGVYLMSAPTERHEPTGRSWDVTLKDKLSILDEDLMGETFSLDAGQNVVDAIRQVIADAGETNHAISADPRVLLTPMTWPPNTSRLTIVQDLLKMINFSPLWVDGWGSYIGEPFVDPQNLPISEVFVEGEDAIHLPTFEVTKDVASIPNRLIGVSSSSASSLVVTADNDDPTSPYSITARNRVIARSEDFDAPDIDTLAGLVARRMRELMAPASVVKFRHAVIPLSTGSVVRFSSDGVAMDGVVLSTSVTLAVGQMMETTIREVVRVGLTVS